MTKRGPMRGWFALLAIGWFALGLARADEGDAPTELPLARRPYRILLWLRLRPTARFPTGVQLAVRQKLGDLASRYLGGVWMLELVNPPAGTTIDNPPDTSALKDLRKGADKVLWIEVNAAPDDRLKSDASVVTAREYDFEFEHWGAIESVPVGQSELLPDEVFAAAYRRFRPTAIMNDMESKSSIDCTVRGLSLTSSESPLPLIAPGSAFRVFREQLRQGERTALVEIPWTYLVFQDAKPHRLSARFSVESALVNPLTRRARGRSQVVAIAAGAGNRGVTALRFVTGKEEHAVVGLDVLLQSVGAGATIPLGATDHRGEIDIRPFQTRSGRSSGLVRVLLLSGNRPIVSLPLVPGDVAEATIPVRFDPLTTEVQGRITALQEEVVDVVARRAILMKLLEKHSRDENVEKVRKVADTINSLPSNEYFGAKFDTIRGWADDRREQLNRRTLGANVQRMYLQTEELFKNHLKGRIEIETSIETLPAGKEDDKAKASARPEQVAKNQPPKAESTLSPSPKSSLASEAKSPAKPQAPATPAPSPAKKSPPRRE